MARPRSTTTSRITRPPPGTSPPAPGPPGGLDRPRGRLRHHHGGVGRRRPLERLRMGAGRGRAAGSLFAHRAGRTRTSCPRGSVDVHRVAIRRVCRSAGGVDDRGQSAGSSPDVISPRPCSPERRKPARVPQHHLALHPPAPRRARLRGGRSGIERPLWTAVVGQGDRTAASAAAARGPQDGNPRTVDADRRPAAG